MVSMSLARPGAACAGTRDERGNAPGNAHGTGVATLDAPHRRKEHPVHTTLARLDAEWRELTESPQSNAALERWQRDEPALGDGGTLDDVLVRRRDSFAAPAILSALGRLAPIEPLAARTLLQALIPGLVRLASTAGYDDPAALDELVSLAWERIRTYPATRHGSVAANVLLDTRKRYRSHRSIEAPTAPVADFPAATTSPSAEREALDRTVLSDLAAARDHGVITGEVLDVIVRTRLVGDALEDVADEHGCTVSRLAQRRWRAERRLREWLPPLAS
jgi:DNA-directed RNA polymerase specialized sigma24 family protein